MRLIPREANIAEHRVIKAPQMRTCAAAICPDKDQISHLHRPTRRDRQGAAGGQLRKGHVVGLCQAMYWYNPFLVLIQFA